MTSLARLKQQFTDAIGVIGDLSRAVLCAPPGHPNPASRLGYLASNQRLARGRASTAQRKRNSNPIICLVKGLGSRKRRREALEKPPIWRSAIQVASGRGAGWPRIAS